MTLTTLRATRAQLAADLARLDAEITAEVAPLLRLHWERHGHPTAPIAGVWTDKGRWLSAREVPPSFRWTAHDEQGHEPTEAEAMLAAERVAGVTK